MGDIEVANQVFLIGNLTKDPTLSETPSGVALCKFSIAVNRNYTNNEGNREVDFHNIVTWRGQAEVCGKFLKKGSKVAIIGSLQNRTYEDKDGIKRTVTDIIASEVEFLSSVTEEKPKPTLIEVDDEECPF